MDYSEATNIWITENILPAIQVKYLIIKKHIPKDEFGECIGIDFENEKKSGIYLYLELWNARLRAI